jgi:hypothetical protein
MGWKLSGAVLIALGLVVGYLPMYALFHLPPEGALNVGLFPGAEILPASKVEHATFRIKVEIDEWKRLASQRSSPEKPIITYGPNPIQ